MPLCFQSRDSVLDARDTADDKIYILVSINNFDYLLHGLPSVVVFEKYAFKFFTALASLVSNGE